MVSVTKHRQLWILGGFVLLGLIVLASVVLLDATGRALAANTLCLVAFTLALSLPAGTVLAALLLRTDLPGRTIWLGLLVVQLFVPLYLHAAAWDAGFGVMGWFTTIVGTETVWLEKMRGAVWVHAVTALPWVVLIVGAGLRLVEPELEEEALLHASPHRVFLHVTLRRCLPALGVAAIWVAVTTAGEMTATDLFVVRTFAEEIYRSLIGGSSSGGALLAVLPLVVLVACLVFCAVPLLARLVPPPRPPSVTISPVFRLGAARWPTGIAVAVVVVLLTAVPLGSLCYKAGMDVTRAPIGDSFAFVRSWSPAKLADMVWGSGARFGDDLSWSFQLSLLAATSAVVLGLPLAWLARSGGWRSGPTLGVLAAALAIPGPIIGLGLIWLLNRDLDVLFFLYNRTLVAPWLALLVRTLPWTILILWFALRSISTDMLDSAATEGAGPITRLFRVALPARLTAVAVAWLVAFVVAWGDLAATVVVLPPGVTTISVRIFVLVHSAADDQVAGVCLGLVLISAMATITAAGLWLMRYDNHERP